MVKPLSFKGDKKPKKRKRHGDGTELSATSTTTETSTKLARIGGGGGGGEAATAENDDSWVSAEAADDVSGPVVIVLAAALSSSSSPPPSCVACDAYGSVFASPLENLIEGNPSTAEPHDVRQVWVATKIAGSRHVNFKGHHGRYLSCDKFGVLSASREAVSNEENFLCVASPDSDGTFSLQTERDTYLTVKEGKKGTEVRGDAEEIDTHTTLRIRMQARFKSRLKASREEKAREKISRKELEEAVGRRLEDDEVKRLKRARREGNYHEAILDARVKNKHDKYS